MAVTDPDGAALQARRASKRAGRRPGRPRASTAAGAGARRDESFVICVPPPNVTGELHIGHALNGSMQDALDPLAPDAGLRHALAAGLRPRRASRRRTWSRSSCSRRARSRQEIGREAFLERTWAWLEQTGRMIMGQYRRLGCSLDYARERFTMDDAYVERRDDLLRPPLGARLDLPREPDRQLVPATTRPRSPTSRSSTWRWTTRSPTRATRSPTATAATAITIATVRPATILADVAVAVHPDDPRYARRDRQGGRRSGRRAPRAGDRGRARRAGVRLGRAQDHAGPRSRRLRDRPRPRAARALTVIGPDGRMIDAAGVRGADAGGGRRARRRVAEGARAAREARALPALGRHLRALPLADRAARLAAVVVPDGRARARLRSRRCGRAASASTPRASTGSRSSRSSTHPDWCVSRQLWWGHQIPIWTCPDGSDLTLRRGRRPTRAPSAARASSCARPTCSTPGSRRRSGRSRRSAGPSETPELAALLPGRRQRRRRARSSASGRTG